MSRSPSHPVDDSASLEAFFASMRATITQYRDALQASNDEKVELVETIRSLKEQLEASRQREKSARPASREPSPSTAVSNDIAVSSQISDNEKQRQVERLSNELRIAASKHDHMVREIERTHKEYGDEIRRLHRIIARLEANIDEMAQYQTVLEDGASGVASSAEAARGTQ